jgi:hypothetical protein
MLTSAHLPLEAVMGMLEHDREDVSRAAATAAAMYDTVMKPTATLDQRLLVLQQHLRDRFN